MGARGPKAKPTALRMLEGNAGKLAINHNEPQPTGQPTCPDWLSIDAKRQWQRLAPILENCGILTAADRDTLAAYCEATGNYIEATKSVQRGLFIDGKTNPAINLQDKFLAQMAKFGTRLGLSPADRTGIKVLPQYEKSRWTGLIAS